VKHYRALFSMPIEAESDEEARTMAAEQAGALRGRGGGADGHVEMIGEVREGTIQISRVIHGEGWFEHQLHPDWKA
jgi:hypothetical protein